MALSQKEKKRRSRASKSKKYHDMEREASRKRMAIYRAKNKAQKRASQLRSLLGPEDAAEVGVYVARQRQLLVSDWFSYRGLRFRPKMLREPTVLRGVMSKIEMHKIELQVAEFEISIIEDWEDDEGEEERRMDFVPSARLEIDRRKGANSVAPRLLARAKGKKCRLEHLEQSEPDAVTRRDRSVQGRAEMDVSSSEAMPGSGSKPEPALPLQTQTIAQTDSPSRKYGQTLRLPSVGDQENQAQMNSSSSKYSKALGLPSAEKQEVVTNNDIDHLITQTLAPVVSDAEEASADGEVAVTSPVSSPPYVADAPPSHVLPSLPTLPSFAKGRYADEVARSEEGIHRAVAEAIQLYRILPRPTARRQAREEEQFLFDASVDRAVAAAMVQLHRGGALRRRTVAPPPGVEGPVVRAEDARLPATGPCESEEAPEDRIDMETMQLSGEGPAERAEDARSMVPPKSEEAEALRSPDNQEVVEALRAPENDEFEEAMQFFVEGLLGDVPPELGAVDEAQVPQDELLRMDMECFDIGDNGLEGLESSSPEVGGINEESFSAEAYLW